MNNKYKQRISRLTKRDPSSPCTPKRKADNLLRKIGKTKVLPCVKKRLVSSKRRNHEATIDLLRRNAWKGHWRNMLCMKIVKKYKMVRWLRNEDGIDTRRMKTVNKIRQHDPLRTHVINFFERRTCRE